MSTFAVNQWYVAAYSRDITEVGDSRLLRRTVCGESILFWRTSAGELTAMADRCVHRRFPLSQAPSRLIGDELICGYHGFTYGSDGVCVAVPGQERIPRTARLTRYPVVECDSFVWVWIGDPDSADRSAVPRASYLDSPDYAVVSGMEPLAARHSLLVDNLLDLSHETYLHGGYIGTPEVASTPITTEVDEDAGLIFVSRHMADAQCPPFYAKSTGLSERITRCKTSSTDRRACTSCIAGSLRWGACRMRTAPIRTPSTWKLCTRSRRRPSTAPTIFGRWLATSRSRTAGCPTFSQKTTGQS